MAILNESTRCEGAITRKNTKNDNEFSAIDFVVASHNAEEMVSKMLIDEMGIHKVRGKNETDHNTISIQINISQVDRKKAVKNSRTLTSKKLSKRKFSRR